jgi:hypothetical protein
MVLYSLRDAVQRPKADLTSRSLSGTISTHRCFTGAEMRPHELVMLERLIGSSEATVQFRKLMPAVLIWFAALWGLMGCQGFPARPPSYRISVGESGNRVTAQSNGQETAFEVRSETGIGSAQVEQTSGEPPAKVGIRLFLDGLEEFDFGYDATRIVVSVSSHGDNAVSQSLLKDGSGETPIGPDSPYWMPVQVVTGPMSDSQKSTGCFELQAPQDYIQGEHRAFSMRWIDFFR